MGIKSIRLIGLVVVDEFPVFWLYLFFVASYSKVEILLYTNPVLGRVKYLNVYIKLLKQSQVYINYIKKC